LHPDKKGTFSYLNLKFKTGTGIRLVNLCTGHWPGGHASAVDGTDASGQNNVCLARKFFKVFISTKTYHALPCGGRYLLMNPNLD
jgi:hypothetical protein